MINLHTYVEFYNFRLVMILHLSFMFYDIHGYCADGIVSREKFQGTHEYCMFDFLYCKYCWTLLILSCSVTILMNVL
jgi:hypothetical protein